MRVILLLLLGISGCLFLAKKVFSSQNSKLLKTIFNGLALVQSVMLTYILVLAIVFGHSLSM